MMTISTLSDYIMDNYDYNEEVDDFCMGKSALSGTEGYLDENFENLVNDFLNQVERKGHVNGNEIVLHRKIGLSRGAQPRPCLGKSWSLTSERATAYCVDRSFSDVENRAQDIVELTATFSVTDIDWLESFHLYVLVDFKDYELQPKDGVTPLDLKVAGRPVVIDDEYRIAEYQNS
ncbi:hypothetical protein [Vibrio chaetopteri]|uniref:Uncharacterized protein n=1 Tax=Vibrio chaetopteri TaxID=3016528 RepID=A0AAU8BRT0_9VIBR